jgi:RHS repeat-associated protein
MRAYCKIEKNRRFELSNHLGNVLVTVSDKRIAVCTLSETVAYYKAEIITASDYYSFGSIMEGRYYEADTVGYRFGWNGKPTDDEINGRGNTISFEARIYDSRTGRYFSGDPREKEYPWQSTYVYFSNSPIAIMDFLGKGGVIEEIEDGTPNGSSGTSSQPFTPISKLAGTGNLLVFINEAGVPNQAVLDRMSDQWDYIIVESLSQAKDVLSNSKAYGGKTGVIKNFVYRSHPGNYSASEGGNGALSNGRVLNDWNADNADVEAAKEVKTLLTNDANIMFTACSILQGDISAATETAKRYTQFWIKGTNRAIFMNYTLSHSHTNWDRNNNDIRDPGEVSYPLFNIYYVSPANPGVNWAGYIKYTWNNSLQIRERATNYFDIQLNSKTGNLDMIQMQKTHYDQ